ncbi:SirB1 family protein [Rhodoferax aquaticus]|uniref:Tetratricopeptide repeat protein n=1 Tax=Rhodoferax aquaticus TaxID=2527691 RepID=A0A515EMS1_9BURK|nr:tetratricopeptide repeat protein [Rhodoferax aquaticus]QDL53977.1 tetratricopeptide repeat protein [Rhodoferax aquaticus]
MQLSLTPPSPIAYFSTLTGGDDDFPLLEAAVSLAQDTQPDLDVQGVLLEVDAWGARVAQRLAADAGPLQRLKVLNQFFYKEMGFANNLNDFYNPSNSFVHTLMESRRGIPISLAVLWMELAQGVGLSVKGIAFPGHFLVKVMLPMGQAVIDPVDGQSLSRERLSEMLEPFRPVSGWDADADVPLGAYLRGAKPRDILARMLHNLKEIYKSESQWPQLLAVQERLVVLLPKASTELRDRGLVHAKLGNTAQALKDLEAYLQASEIGVDFGSISHQVETLRSL